MPSMADIHWPAALNQVPKEIFFRDDIYRLEMERIFSGPEWHPIAHRAEIPEPGNFKTGQVGEIPVIVVHGDDGTVRAFANSCPHRGTQLITCGRGSADKIECPYHRWTFNNRGDLLGVPGMGDFPPEFRKADYGLRRLRSGEVHGVVFVSLSDRAPDLDTYLGEVVPYIAKAFGGDGRLRLLGYHKFGLNANWKEYNDSDGYHGPLLHTAFRHLKFVMANGSQFMTRHAHKINSIDTGNGENSGFLRDHSVVEARDTATAPQTTVITFFPLAQIIRNLDSISVRYAFPVSPHRTEVQFAYFCREADDPELVRHRVRQVSNLQGPSGLITLEDGAVFNRQHVGAYAPGTISFFKGFRGQTEGPCTLDKMDEAGNLVRWEHYRRAMGLDRDRSAGEQRHG